MDAGRGLVPPARRLRGWTAAAFLGLALLPGSRAIGARENVPEKTRQESMAPSGRSIDVREVLNVPVEDVLRVVTDYERYAEMIPDIFSAEVLRRADNQVDVRFKYHLVMAGDLDITRRFVQHGQSRVEFSTLGGDLGELSGAWTLAPGDEPGTTKVSYVASLKPSFDAPAFLVRYVLKSEAPRILDHVERIANAKPKA